MSPERLAHLLDALPRRRPLVLGDAMLDEYVWGTATRVSQEAPVLVVRSREVSHVPGGAANVLHCLQALDVAAGLVAVVGRDHPAENLHRLLESLGVEPLHLLPDAARQTTVKTRVVAQGQQVLRIDHETTTPLAEPIADELLTRLAAGLETCDSLLLSDYDKGVLTGETIPRVLAAARAAGALVGVNAKPRWAAAYRGVDLLTVNRAEASAIADTEVDDLDSALAVAGPLAERLDCGLLLITLGPDGAVYAARGEAPRHLAAVPVEVADPSGAGDTTLAAAHLALCAGASPAEAVELAMFAAGVVVRKLGVATASRAEIAEIAGLPTG